MLFIKAICKLCFTSTEKYYYSSYKHRVVWSSFEFRQKADTLWIYQVKKKKLQTSWHRLNGQTTFCDLRVFNPLATCLLHHSLPAVHKKNVNEKKREYNQWILQVEHGSFTPLVFSCFGGISRECSRFFSHNAERLARTEEKNVKLWSVHG